MAQTNFTASVLAFLGACVVSLLMGAGLVFAHCDTMDGPIIKSAQEALETGKIDLVLMWIQKDDEAELKQAFQHAREVRKLNSAAQELADRYFLETFVRIHRAGEGAPFTGIKPAGTDLNPGVEKADHALETGKADELLQLMSATVAQGVRAHYERALALKKHAGESVAAGREYAEAYVKYVHYIEKLYDDAAKGMQHHGHGHAAPAPAEKHAH